jgi:hypothetical protein
LSLRSPGHVCVRNNSLIACFDLVFFTRTGIISLLFILLSKHIIFFLFSNIFVACVRVFGLIGTIFVIIFLILILILFDSLVLVYKNFFVFLVTFACFLRIIIVLFLLILVFFYTSFSVIII